MQNFNISCKILTNTTISNETKNIQNAKLYRYVTIFYRQEVASLFKVQEKLRACGIQNKIFCDSHIKIIWSLAIVFSEHADMIKYDKTNMIKHYSTKVP